MEKNTERSLVNAMNYDRNNEKGRKTNYDRDDRSIRD